MVAEMVTRLKQNCHLIKYKMHSFFTSFRQSTTQTLKPISRNPRHILLRTYQDHAIEAFSTMAGRGRGTASLMSVLEQQTGSNPLQKTAGETVNKVRESGTTMSMLKGHEEIQNAIIRPPAEEASPPLGVFSRTQHNNPLPSGGRGLMTPGHFQKNIPPKGSPQGQPEKLFTSPTSGTIPKVAAKNKTPELENAMAYLNKYAKGEQQVKMPAHSNQKKIQSNPKVNQIQTKPMPMKSSSMQNQQKQLTPVLTPKEKAEADAEWQKYKFQRQINQIIANSTLEDAAEVFSDLKIKLDECSLSQKYSQYDELGLMLESLIDKATGSTDFVDLSKTFIKLIADYDPIKFEDTFPPLVSRKIEELVRVSASDKAMTTCAQKFCQLLGKLYKISSEAESRFHSVILSCLGDCIEQWTYPDGIGSGVAGFHIIKANTHASAATEVFKVMALQDTEKDSVEQVMNDVGRMVMLLKESVLNECLPRKIREIYLDLLLAHTPRGQHGRRLLFSASLDRQQAGISDSDATQEDEMPWRKKNISESTTSSFSNQVNDEVEELQLQEDYKEARFRGAASDTYDDSISSTQVDDVDDTVIIESEEVDAATAVDEKEAESERETGSEREVMEDEASQGDTENDVEVEAWEYEPAKPKFITGSVAPEVELGPYGKIKTMMKDLKLEDQIFRFEDNVIRDTVLGADREELKNILKEASFPAGVIYEICLYLDKNFGEGGKTGRGDQNRWSSSETDARFTAPNFRFKDSRNNKFGNKPQQGDFGTESGPRKKLLGIGRGGSSFESSRNKSRGRFNDAAAKGQQNQKTWGRNRSGSFEEKKSGNWRGRDERARNPGRSSPSVENRRFQGDASNIQDAHPRYHRQSSGGETSYETRQVGKVTPLQNPQEMAMPRERRSPNAEQKPGGVFGFGGQPQACYRCGSKEHMSFECTDMKSVFIG